MLFFRSGTWFHIIPLTVGSTSSRLPWFKISTQLNWIIANHAKFLSFFTYIIPRISNCGLNSFNYYVFFLIVATKRRLNQASSKNVSEGKHFNSCFFYCQQPLDSPVDWHRRRLKVRFLIVKIRVVELSFVYKNARFLLCRGFLKMAAGGGKNLMDFISRYMYSIQKKIPWFKKSPLSILQGTVFGFETKLGGKEESKKLGRKKKM
jgi:hypothetical protein